MFAGGTSAHPGKRAYQYTFDHGVKRGNWGGFVRYSIDPISYANGRHRGYVLTVLDNGQPESLGMFRSPQAAAKAASIHATENY